MEDAVKYNELFQFYGFNGLKDACEAFVARLDEETKTITLGELLSSYEQANQSNWGHRYIQGWKTLCSLLEPNTSHPLATLDKPHWRTWMDAQQKERNWVDRTYNDYLSRLSSIWKYAVDNDLIEKNPIEGIVCRRLKTKAVSILSVSQVGDILNTAWDHDREMVPYFAIGIYAGLRPDCELLELEWEDVNFKEKWIRVKFGNKTDTKRFVPIEDNLLHWLKPWKKAKGSIAPVNLVKRRRYIVRGKYHAPEGSPEKDWTPIASWSQRDIMRHSYGSYLDGKYRDRNMVKENMGHSNFKTYDQHYRRAVTPKAHNPARHLKGIATAKEFHERMEGLDHEKLPSVEAVVIARRRLREEQQQRINEFEERSAEALSQTFTRHYQEQEKLVAYHDRQINRKHTELKNYYKLPEKQAQIDKLKQQLEHPNFIQKVSFKLFHSDQKLEQQITTLEANQANAEQRLDEALEPIKQERTRRLQSLEKRHARELEDLKKHLSQWQPAERTLRQEWSKVSHEQDMKRDHDQGYDAPGFDR